MASLNSFAEALKAAAASASLDIPVGSGHSLEELFSTALKDALIRVSNGQIDSYDLGVWTVSNLLILAAHEGYELNETTEFLRIILE